MRYRFASTDAVIRRAIETGCFPAASLLIGQGERVLFRRAYGRLSIEENAPPATEHTLYDLDALTTPLTVGMLSLRALEEGRWCLWDQLGSFIEAPADKAGLSIEQLLTHTAGFPAQTNLWEHTHEPMESAGVILQTPLIAPPGTRACFSGLDSILLGQLLECLYDTELSALAKREIFDPLGMAATCYNPVDGNIAATEMQDDGRCLQGVAYDENTRFLGGVSGGAGLFSTMDDLALFLQMLCARGRLADGSRFLCGATVDAALRNRIPGMNGGFGLGLQLPWYADGYIGDLFPCETVGHTGATGVSLTLDPKSGLYVVLLTNSVCPSRDNGGIHRVRRLVHNSVMAQVDP